MGIIKAAAPVPLYCYRSRLGVTGQEFAAMHPLAHSKLSTSCPHGHRKRRGPFCFHYKEVSNGYFIGIYIDSVLIFFAWQ